MDYMIVFRFIERYQSLLETCLLFQVEILLVNTWETRKYSYDRPRGVMHYFAPSACLSKRIENVCRAKRFWASVRPVFCRAGTGTAGGEGGGGMGCCFSCCWRQRCC